MSIITWGEGQGGVGAFDVKAGDIRASAETPLPASAVSWFPFISSWTLRGRNLGSVSLGLSRWGRVYTGEADSSLSGMKPGIGRWGGTVLVFLGRIWLRRTESFQLNDVVQRSNGLSRVTCFQEEPC